RHHRQHLGGDERLVPPPNDGLADGALRTAQAIELGGVDEIDAKVKGSLGDAERLAVREGPAVAPLWRSKLPGSHADHRQPDATHLDITHAEKVSEPGPGRGPRPRPDLQGASAWRCWGARGGGSEERVAMGPTGPARRCGRQPGPAGMVPRILREFGRL